MGRDQCRFFCHKLRWEFSDDSGLYATISDSTPAFILKPLPERARSTELEAACDAHRRIADTVLYEASHLADGEVLDECDESLVEALADELLQREEIGCGDEMELHFEKMVEADASGTEEAMIQLREEAVLDRIRGASGDNARLSDAIDYAEAEASSGKYGSCRCASVDASLIL